MTNSRALLIGWAAAAACGAALVVAAHLVAPDPKDIRPLRQESGLFGYHRGHVGATAYSTLQGRELLCGASIAGTYSQCPIARDGEVLVVTFVRLPTLFRDHEVAIEAVGTQSVPYRLTPSQLADDWLSRSYWDAAFHSILVGFFSFAIASAFASRSKASE